MTTHPRLAVLRARTGVGDHPPVVLLHGFASSATIDFVDTGWFDDFDDREAVAIDLPGHGGSAPVATAVDGETATVVAAIVDAIRGTAAVRVDVIGYSLGARLAWELPAAAPTLIRRLVLGGLSPEEPFAAVDLAALRVAVGLEPRTGGDPSDDLGAGPTGGLDPLTAMIADMISAPGLRTAALANLIGGLARQPFAPAENAPAVPTLLVAGRDDRMSAHIDELLKHLPDAALLRVPGDHRGALDSAEFRAVARAFLG